MTPQQMLNLYSEMGVAVRQGLQNITLTGIQDTPTGYQGHSGDYLVVNNNESGIHFTSIEKIAADLTDYGFGGTSDKVIPRQYEQLPFPIENDGEIVKVGCDLYVSCDGAWKIIDGGAGTTPTENIPGCVETLEDYNNYTNYVDSIISNSMSSAFENAFDFGAQNTFLNDVCLYKDASSPDRAKVKIQESSYQFGIFEDNTTITINAETPTTAASCASLHIKSDVAVDPNGIPAYDVELSLQSNTTNDSTTFTNSSTKNLTVSSNGNTKHSTTVTKYGSSSLKFDGSSHLSVPGNSPELLFSLDDDITIESWFYITEDPTLTDYMYIIPILSKGRQNTAYHGWTLGYVHPNATSHTAYRGMCVVTFNGGGGWGDGSWALFGSSILNKNQWHHAAAVKSGGVWHLYVNGVLENSSPDITGGSGQYLNVTNADLLIGASTSYSSGYNVNLNTRFIGYTQDMRISRGAPYIQDFTPSTTFLDTVGGQDTRTPERLLIQDSSINNTFIQKVDDIEHTSTATNIYGQSSLYFNREDYLLIDKDTPGLNFTENDEITFEFWMKYIDVVPVDHQPFVPILAKGPMNTVSKSFVIGVQTDGSIQVQLMQNRSGGQQFSSTGSINQNEWGHVAVTRRLGVESEGVLNGFWSIYINGIKQELTEQSNGGGFSEDLKSLEEYNTAHLDNSVYHFTIGSAYAYHPMTLEANRNKYYGYLQDIRVFKGSAVYDQDFTPPNTFLDSLCESANTPCSFVEWRTNDNSIIGNVNDTVTTALINNDTSITGVFNCT